jgi:hypothetical protein
MQCSGYANALVDIERLLNSFTVIEGVKCENAGIDFTEKKRIHNPVECTYFKGDKFRINLFGKHNVRIDDIRDDRSDISIKDEDRILEEKNKHSEDKDSEENAEYKITQISESDKWTVVLSVDPMQKDRKDKPKNAACMYLNGEIRGIFSGKIYGETGLSESGREITRFFEFAFDKTSQSVVDGAVSARNYEYLWIYAHHTITYHTNYLTMHMLKQYCEILHEGNKRNILDELSGILEDPPRYPFVSSGGNVESGEIDLDKLFDKLFDAILSLSLLRKIIVRDEQQGKDFYARTGIFLGLRKDEDLETWIPDKENLKSTLERIKTILENIPRIKDQGEYVLLRLIELYTNNLNADASGIRKDDQRKKYLNEFINWIIALLKGYYTVRLMHDTRGKLIAIFHKLVQLVEDVIKNKNADNFAGVGKLLLSARINDQKLRLFNDTLKYMCDVIAMLDKKTINNFVYSRSGDDDLNAYYRSLENVLSQKDEVNRTPNEREFLAVADEYFSRNFAAAMWKTYTEYTYLFRNWEEEEINRLPKTFDNFLILTGGGVINDKDYFDYIYFVLSENMTRLTDEQREIYILLQKYGITRFVFVRQNVKAKTLDAYSTFFAFKENVLRFRDIELFNKQKINRPFFYFYYKRNDGSPLETDEVTKLLEELHDMIKEKIEKAAESGSGPNKQKG